MKHRDPRSLTGIKINMPASCSGILRSLRAILLLCTIAFSLLATPGHAQTEPNPPNVLDGESRYAGWNVTDFTLAADTLSTSGPDDELSDLLSKIQKGLALNGRFGILGRKLPAFSGELLDEDIRRSRLFLAREGYPASKVRTEIDPDLRERTLELALWITPGPRVCVEDVTMGGIPAPLQPAADSLRALEAQDDRYSDRRALMTASTIANLLQESGYAEVTIESRPRRQPSGGVILHFDVRPGDLYRIGSIAVDGLPPDLVPLAEMRLEPVIGEVYSPTHLDRVRADLRDLEILRMVQLRTEPVAEGELELRAHLTTRPYRVTSASVGTWTDHTYRIKASWKHRNLFRRSRGFSVGGAWSPNQWQVETKAWWPSMPTPRAQSHLRVAHEAEREDAYDADHTRLGVAVTFKPDWFNQWMFEAGISHVEVRSHSPDDELRDLNPGEQLTLGITRQGNHTDDLLDPARGVRFRLRGVGSPPGFASDYPFLSGEAGASAYLPLVAGVMLAGRLDLGAATPLGDKGALLPRERFFAGGNSSMRGYARRRLGPRDSEDNPVGGEARLLAGAELRFRLTSWLGMPLFIDAGRVWGQHADFDLVDLEWACGSGIMIFTPVGPIRFDCAYNLTGQRAQPRPPGERPPMGTPGAARGARPSLRSAPGARAFSDHPTGAGGSRPVRFGAGRQKERRRNVRLRDRLEQVGSIADSRFLMDRGG